MKKSMLDLKWNLFNEQIYLYGARSKHETYTEMVVQLSVIFTCCAAENNEVVMFKYVVVKNASPQAVSPHKVQKVCVGVKI